MADGWTPMKVTLDGEGAFSDLLESGVKWQGGHIEELTVIQGGTSRGKPTIALRVRADDGTIVVAQTTWNLLYVAARAVEARYGPSTD